MDQSRKDQPEGTPACARNAEAGAPSGSAGPERRFSTQRKLAVVSCLLPGELLESLARELNVTAARRKEWRDRALVGAEAAMKERERDSRDEELLRPKPKLGEITIANERLEQKMVPLRAGALRSARRRGSEPGHFAGHRPHPWPGARGLRLAPDRHPGPPPPRGSRRHHSGCSVSPRAG